MAYTPTTWINGDSITSTLMNHAETQYNEFATGGSWARWYGLQSADTTGTSVATGITTFVAAGMYGSESPGSNVAGAYYDTDYWASANRTRLVAKKAGYYLIHGKVWHSGYYSLNLVVQLYLNGTTELCKQETGVPAQDGSTTAPFPEMISDIYNFSANDYVEIRAAHDKGSTISVGGGTGQYALAYLTLCLIRV